jgi:hypothetical protein
MHDISHSIPPLQGGRAGPVQARARRTRSKDDRIGVGDDAIGRARRRRGGRGGPEAGDQAWRPRDAQGAGHGGAHGGFHRAEDPGAAGAHGRLLRQRAGRRVRHGKVPVRRRAADGGAHACGARDGGTGRDRLLHRAVGWRPTCCC